MLGGGISGGVGTSEGNNQEGKSSGFSIYPAIGIAIQNNTVMGLRLSYNRSKNEHEEGANQSRQDVNGFGAGVFYRRYMNLSQKFYLFGEGSLNYNRSKQATKNAWQNSTQKISNVGLSFYPGVAYAVSRKMHLEVGLNNLLDISYSRSETESNLSSPPTLSKSSGIHFSTNVSTSAPLTVGFRFVLGK